jgi:hypothetical protein
VSLRGGLTPATVRPSNLVLARRNAWGLAIVAVMMIAAEVNTAG